MDMVWCMSEIRWIESELIHNPSQLQGYLVLISLLPKIERDQ